MDLEIFFMCGEGVGWEGKIMYVFFLDSLGLRFIVELLVFVGDKCLWF